MRTKGRNITHTSSDAQDPLVYLGVGDIFEFPAFEIIHNGLGVLGTQHRYSCLLYKDGYVFFDAEKGKWFILGERLTEISSFGKFNFFLDNNKCYSDNPFIGKGICVVYDEIHDRLIMTLAFQDLIDDTKFKGVVDEYSIKPIISKGDIIYTNNQFKRIN